MSRADKTALFQRNIGEKIVDFFIDKASQEMSIGFTKSTFESFINHYINEGFSEKWVINESEERDGQLVNVRSEVEPKMNLLNDFLIKNYLNASYVQYLVIEKKIHVDSNLVNDFYGNGRTLYGTKDLSSKDLHDALIEAKLEPEAQYKEDFVELGQILKEKLEAKFPIKKKLKNKAS